MLTLIQTRDSFRFTQFYLYSFLCVFSFMLFLIIPSFSYISHNIKFTIVYMYNSIVFRIFKVVQPSLLFHNILITPKITPRSFTNFTPNFSLSPAPTSKPIYILSLWIYLFWTFHINGMLQHVTFCHSFHLDNVSKGHLRCSMHEYFIFFYGQKQFLLWKHCILFVHSFFDEHLNCF